MTLLDHKGRPLKPSNTGMGFVPSQPAERPEIKVGEGTTYLVGFSVSTDYYYPLIDCTKTLSDNSNNISDKQTT